MMHLRAPSALRTQGSQARIDQLENVLFHQTLDALTYDDELKSPLDTYLSKMAKISSSSEDTERNEEVKVRLEALAADLTKFNCNNCIGGSGSICCGHVDDALKVANFGNCLAVIRELFELVKNWSHQLYGHFASDLCSDVPRFFEFESKIMPDRGFGLGDNFAVTGTTSLVSLEEKDRFRICLYCDVESIGWPDLLALVYVFTHEFVCHGHQRKSELDGPVNFPSAYCSWTEGWMDSLCETLVQLSLQGTSGPTEIPMPQWLSMNADSAMPAVSHRHDRRYQTPKKRRKVTNSINSIKYARQCFHKYLRAITKLENNIHAGIELVTSLSLRLNAMELSLVERRHIMTLLGQANIEFDNDRTKAILQLGNEFVLTGDPVPLLAAKW